MLGSSSAIAALLFGWYKFFREVPQPAWITGDPEKNFLYGSIGSESQAGMPYWIVVVLPRIFGDSTCPGPAAMPRSACRGRRGREFPDRLLEEDRRLRSRRVQLRALPCHAYRLAEHQTPTIVAAGGSNTADIQGLLDFFSKSASDPRFNADTILTEIDLAYRAELARSAAVQVPATSR